MLDPKDLIERAAAGAKLSTLVEELAEDGESETYQALFTAMRALIEAGKNISTERRNLDRIKDAGEDGVKKAVLILDDVEETVQRATRAISEMLDGVGKGPDGRFGRREWY